MPPGAPSTPGWVYDASSGYYHDPSTGAYFDQQRGAYHVNGRWVGHAEFTATRVASAASPQHVVHPSLSRGGVGESAVGGGSANLVHHPAAIPGAAGAAPRSTPGWGASVPAYASSSSGAYDPSGARASAETNAYDPGGGTGTPAVSASFVAPAPVVARPTALGQAAERGDVRECARLIRSGEDPDAPGPLGNRPLHYAAHEGHGRIVELLLAGERADANARNNRGATPLHNAAAGGHAECLAAMLRAGADPNALDVDGASPLHVALDRRAIEALLSRGADPNVRKLTDGRTPLFAAAERGDGWATEAMLAAGASPDASDGGGRAPLHATSDWRCAKALAAGGADLEAVDANGHTPLHVAASEGKAEVVKRLLEAGADPGARAKPTSRSSDPWGGIGRFAARGSTAVDLARAAGHAEVTRLLSAGRGGGGGSGHTHTRREGEGGVARMAEKENDGRGSSGAPGAFARGVFGVFSGGGTPRARVSARTGYALLGLACVVFLAFLVVAGGVVEMRRELAEWREIRAKRAAKAAKAESAAKAKREKEEEAARHRAAASDAEVARILGCPARVTEEATRLAEEAKRKGEPKPRKDISAAHRCVLGLGPYAARTGSSAAGSSSGGEGGKGEGSEETCAVCAGFLTSVAEKLRIEMAGKSAVGDAAATAADRLLGTACAEAEEAGNSRHSKLCDSLLAARREVARPMGLGVPPGKVCERVARKDPLVCEIKPAKEGDATDDGAGDAAAADAFKRLSLLVHPDKHRGKRAGDAAKAFRELKKAKDHFDLLARRAAEKKEREEAGM